MRINTPMNVCLSTSVGSATSPYPVISPAVQGVASGVASPTGRPFVGLFRLDPLASATLVPVGEPVRNVDLSFVVPLVFAGFLGVMVGVPAAWCLLSRRVLSNDWERGAIRNLITAAYEGDLNALRQLIRTYQTYENEYTLKGSLFWDLAAYPVIHLLYALHYQRNSQAWEGLCRLYYNILPKWEMEEMKTILENFFKSQEIKGLGIISWARERRESMGPNDSVPQLPENPTLPAPPSFTGLVGRM